jgi:hypothetical protein
MARAARQLDRGLPVSFSLKPISCDDFNYDAPAQRMLAPEQIVADRAARITREFAQSC